MNLEQLFKKQDQLYNLVKKNIDNRPEFETLLASCSIKYVHRNDFD